MKNMFCVLFAVAVEDSVKPDNNVSIIAVHYSNDKRDQTFEANVNILASRSIWPRDLNIFGCS